MQFSFAAVLALATAAFAQRAALPNPDFNPVTSPTEHQKVQAGTTLTIKWTVPAAFASAKVNLILIGGPEQNLQTPLLNIVDGLDNSLGEYAWSVPADQGGFPWYGITIEDVADPVNNYQFSPPFDIEKSAAASGSTSTVTLTTASGTATVILSSAVPTTTSVSSSAVETTTSSSSIKETSSEIKTTAVVSSSVAYPVPTLVTITSSSVAIVAASSTSAVPAAESSPVLVGDSAAVQAKAGVFAVLGGLAVALML
ncbi:Ser-Thr-rich glycosyl-phosphatidyl-inositol-anchored membrane family-domain-containing protein [Plectosphaerella plurivora]|uniref:Ser-Thr-rich glycosyl-phosphatidyl-inositol-anchored membrane family-domain-containing protein n=1 Tax=Plectosphaerella plurivora TaxID=936078 RepID=A0A9P8VHA6_9PEZI|nr:Ser-Thr-rich glycosyl-phosphatidyl-inositol-anchored membrane family-domain-containing protein [Plectosphaerella plurivora]